MNNQNLAKPLPYTNNSHIQAERGRKGGQSTSPKKKDAAKLRWLKEKLQLGKTDLQQILEFVNDRKSAALQIYTFIHKQFLDAPIMTRKERLLLSRIQIECMKVIHGEKHHIQSENLHIHVFEQNLAQWEQSYRNLSRLETSGSNGTITNTKETSSNSAKNTTE